MGIFVFDHAYSDASVVFDVCIVGSGPAGLTLAAELADTGKRICILESGLNNKTAFADSLRRARSDGDVTIKVSSRERVFGGASLTWGGLSAPLDPIDFSNRSFLSVSGWPISYAEMMGYYDLASRRYGFPDIRNFSTESIQEKKKTSATCFPLGDFLDEKMFIAADPPWNFGHRLKHCCDLEHVTLLLDATVTCLSSECVDGRVRVTCVRVRSRDGVEADIRARYVVLAAGGIENARILLLSKETCSSGLGNEKDVVGRYFMNHPKEYYGTLRLNSSVRDIPYLFGSLQKGWASYVGIRLREDEQLRRGVLNSYIRFEPVFPWTDRRGVWALLALVKRLKYFAEAWKRSQGNRVVALRDYSETGDDLTVDEWTFLTICRDLVKDFPAVCSYAFHRVFSEVPLLIRTIRLRNFMEMEPCAKNRITLGSEIDAHGKNIPVVHLSPTPLDRLSMIDLHERFGDVVRSQGIGSFESDLSRIASWPIVGDASHHLGSTRMGISPETSVVNADLRVHTVENLYVVGGSVFPTSGCSNPTFTICALAIRLAEKLRSIL